MKEYLLLLFLIGSTFSFNSAFAQAGGGGRGGPGGGFGYFRGGALEQDFGDTNLNESLPRFDLEFGGGEPKDLVQAIEKASGKPLNAVIPTEDANAPLPPFSVKQVSVQQLFLALAHASVKEEVQVTGYNRDGNGDRIPSVSFIETSYGFKTVGTPTENSVWYFYWHKPRPMPGPEPAIVPPVCRFYQLGSYLDAGYKVEDITTAIETAWKMLGETNPLKISYHKDTKLLIAVGQPENLGVIENVLASLTEKPKQKPREPEILDKPKDK